MEQAQHTSKIFGIGLLKTGTRSLNNALKMLGYSATHYPKNLRQIERNDAATDTTVTIIFEKLDAMFPGSKFIYTMREREEWLESCRRHYHRRKHITGPLQSHTRISLFGTISYDRELFIQGYERLDVRIRNYFSARPDDLLSINICDGSATWDPICEFLGKSIPNAEFPWANQSSTGDQLLIRLLNVVRNVQLTAKISNAHRDYLVFLSRNHGQSDDEAKERLDWEYGGYHDRIIVGAVNHFGNVETTAAKLNVSVNSIKQSLTRSSIITKK